MSSKIYDKCDDSDFGIVNFPFLAGEVPRACSNGVYISQIIWFARASRVRNETDAKLLQQEYQYHKLLRAFFLSFIVDELVSKYETRLKHFCYKDHRNLNFIVTWCID